MNNTVLFFTVVCCNGKHDRQIAIKEDLTSSLKIPNKFLRKLRTLTGFQISAKLFYLSFFQINAPWKLWIWFWFIPSHVTNSLIIIPLLVIFTGGYYLTSAYGALSLIKNFQEEQAARLLCSEARNTLRQWHKRRTTNRTIPSVDDFQVSFMFSRKWFFCIKVEDWCYRVRSTVHIISPGRC